MPSSCGRIRSDAALGTGGRGGYGTHPQCVASVFVFGRPSHQNVRLRIRRCQTDAGMCADSGPNPLLDTHDAEVEPVASDWASQRKKNN